MQKHVQRRPEAAVSTEAVLPLHCDTTALSAGVEYDGGAYAVAGLCMHSGDVLPS